ncbi:hypothetical protein GUITHDRAFT_145790 [Guillardia theta CCMP2712]|uniref:Uncharacterized protein n=2 Tax=Guillardia theta TaxID=55529 RepID=L1IJL8_GUITC|nr:hypothetical protein GUITHDRAFT_145790 [Guillardia theta CCMP2712]EKX36431.1 hypothetical protein GUITHDRAFT_145790 [Guillardia theta CCMP2712]|eukprot:XP_005823411.1 hypothetical protein GUITHDRAFT_145790 [Guillardia theta CCMP2712]
MLSRSERVRIDKAEQRRRTRALVLQLDALVPLQDRPLSAEKGSLASRRTIMQLHEDTLAAVKSLRRRLGGDTRTSPIKGEGSASKECSANEEETAIRSPGEKCAKSERNKLQTTIKLENGVDKDVADETARNGAGSKESFVAIPLDSVMEGMLESEMLLLMEVNLADWTVTRMSKGLQRWFSCLPAPGLVGQSLLRFVPSPELPAFRKFLIKDGPVTLSEFSAKVLTFGSQAFECLPCKFVPTQQRCSSIAVFILSIPQLCPSPVTKFPSKLMFDLLRDLCGVFEYDEKVSHPFPWVVDEEFKKRHEHIRMADQTEFGWCQRCVNALLKIDIGKEILEKIINGKANNYDSSEECVLRGVNKMTQFHIMLDLNQSDTPCVIVHTRLKLPREAGAFTTPWSELYRATLNGEPVKKFLSDTGSYLRIYAHRNSAAESLHMTAFHEIPAKEGWECFHSKTWTITPKGMSFQGDIFSKGDKEICTYNFTFKRVEDLDRGLLSSLIQDE